MISYTLYLKGGGPVKKYANTPGPITYSDDRYMYRRNADGSILYTVDVSNSGDGSVAWLTHDTSRKGTTPLPGNVLEGLGYLNFNDDHYIQNGDGTYTKYGDNKNRYGRIIGSDGSSVLLSSNATNATWNPNTNTWEKAGFVYNPRTQRWANIGKGLGATPYYDANTDLYYRTDGKTISVSQTGDSNGSWQGLTNTASLSDNIWSGMGYANIGGHHYIQDGNGTFRRYGSNDLYGLTPNQQGVFTFVSNGNNSGLSWNANTGRWEDPNGVSPVSTGTAGNSASTVNTGRSASSPSAVRTASTFGSNDWLQNLSDTDKLRYLQYRQATDDDKENEAGFKAFINTGDNNSWQSYLNTDPGKQWGFNHYHDTYGNFGTDRKYTNGELIGMNNEDAALLTKEGQAARTAAQTQRQNYTDYRNTLNGKTLTLYNADATAANEAARKKAHFDYTNEYITNKNLAAGISNIKGKAFDRLGQAYNTNWLDNDTSNDFDLTKLSMGKLRRMQRMLEKNATNVANSGLSSADYYGSVQQRTSRFKDPRLTLTEVKNVDENATSYKQGGLLSYKQYTNLK